ncbi:MAG: MauE/DoxX family redox-associated membrane protein [Bacteroidota bacterium]
MKRQIVLEIICFLFILLFAYAAVIKLLDYQKFTVQIGQSPLLTGFGDLIPWLVISIELVISIALLFQRVRLIAFFASFSLMVMFTSYVIAILLFSPYVPCSCGGVLEKMGWTEHLVFNTAFIILGFIGITLQSSKKIFPVLREKISKSKNE